MCPSVVQFLLLTSIGFSLGVRASASGQPVVKVTQEGGGSYVFVTTENGELRGTVTTSLNGTLYSRFLGIPYATPPLGDLRFRAPQPAANWSGTRDAMTMSAACPQSGVGSEDCLYLNVYFPVFHDSPLPVMFYIYGGAFTTGSATGKAPDYFMDKGVMLVTFNYRVGSIGFLSLQNDDITGNAGLKDQVMALQWVQRNIAAFGGDPDRVTVFGESAGGASTSHMLLSPAAKGLFSGVIIESGQASANWTVEPVPREKAYRLAAALGFQTGNLTAAEEDERLAAFLRTANHEDLTVEDSRALSDFEKRRLSPVAWQPVIESPSASAVVTESPISILMEGRYNQVPVMTGVTSADGSVFVAMSGVMQSESVAADLNENFTSLVGSLLPRPTREEQEAAAQQLEDFYFGDQGFSQQQPQAVYDMISDLYFIQDTQAFARVVANTSSFPLYYYYFDYDGYGSTEYGMAHAQETGYLFMRVMGGPNKDPNSNDGKILDLLTTLWTNFAKYGDPAPSGSPVTWEAYTSEASNYLHLKLESETRQDLLPERTQLWEQILPA
ncbi:para-nitrobenzyl esterase-like [Schistocerca nitens]|uniref:para-nitrobenzyl esterase-like n=1 Tax=Schistocerca nitens TaxID=7011 RepID=UPI002117B85D|nr:para-nitrobenzyl esterase-like [Schistocerca nitens]